MPVVSGCERADRRFLEAPAPVGQLPGLTGAVLRHAGGWAVIGAAACVFRHPLAALVTSRRTSLIQVWPFGEV